MATDLAEEIRELIGTGARPITLSEITARARTTPVASFQPAPALLVPAAPAWTRPAASAIPGPPGRHHG